MTRHVWLAPTFATAVGCPDGARGAMATTHSAASSTAPVAAAKPSRDVERV